VRGPEGPTPYTQEGTLPCLGFFLRRKEKLSISTEGNLACDEGRRDVVWDFCASEHISVGLLRRKVSRGRLEIPKLCNEKLNSNHELGV
jgi:hypothetical protein